MQKLKPFKTFIPDPTSIYSAHRLYKIYVFSGKWLLFNDKQKLKHTCAELSKFSNLKMINYIDYAHVLRGFAWEIYLYYDPIKLFDDLDHIDNEIKRAYNAYIGMTTYKGPTGYLVRVGSYIKTYCTNLENLANKRRLYVMAKKIACIKQAIKNDYDFLNNLKSDLPQHLKHLDSF